MNTAMKLGASVAVAATLLGAGPAPALSCMRTDFDIVLKRAHVSEDTYGVFYGSIDVDEASMPSRDAKLSPFTTSARFKGQAVYAGGLGQPFEQKMTVEVQCSGPWCGDIRDGENQLFFARLEGDRMVFEANACGSWMLGETSSKEVEEAARAIGNL